MGEEGKSYRERVKAHLKRPESVRDELYVAWIKKRLEPLIDEMIAMGSSDVYLVSDYVNPDGVKLALEELEFTDDDTYVHWTPGGGGVTVEFLDEEEEIIIS